MNDKSSPFSDNLLIFNQLSKPESAAWQMACDEWLLKECVRPVLRVYAWSEAAWTFGYFQKLEMVRAELCGFPGVLIRRWTGGGLVDHTQDLPYSLILPPNHPWIKLSAAESYLKIHKALVQALQHQGIEANLHSSAPVSGSQCFQSPVPADVILAGRKIAGAAQRRSRHGLLHQGSIQIPGGLLHGNALLVQLAEALAGSFETSDLSDEAQAPIAALVAGTYATEPWLKLR